MQESKIYTPSDFATAIKKRRKSLDLTQRDVAAMTGLSVPTIIAVEKGNDKTGVGVVLSVCESLGLRLVAIGQ